MYSETYALAGLGLRWSDMSYGHGDGQAGLGICRPHVIRPLSIWKALHKVGQGLHSSMCHTAVFFLEVGARADLGLPWSNMSYGHFVLGRRCVGCFVFTLVLYRFLLEWAMRKLVWVYAGLLTVKSCRL